MTREQIDRVVLGTAQLGSDYGVSNRIGQPSRSDALRILETAWDRGVRRFDTAPGYGSENVVAEFCRVHGVGKSICVLTKIPAIGFVDRNAAIDRMRRSLEASCQSLAMDRLDVVFFHDVRDRRLVVDWDAEIQTVMKEFRIRKFGISVYEPEEVDVLEATPLPSACQFPLNIFDRRFVGIVPPTVESYARSVFLQGLLADSRPPVKPVPDRLRAAHSSYHEALRRHGLDPLQTALAFVFGQSAAADYVLVGAESIQQVEATLSVEIPEVEATLPAQETELGSEVDPRTWS